MFTVSSSFIGSFKTGDNINHNLRVLEFLYEIYAQENDHRKRLLCKPIIITLVSIIEAVLHDFHGRITGHTIEGVANLAATVISYIQSKHIDELEKYIASARKHDFFSTRDARFYDSLDVLRKLRNRIHIQNTKGDFEPDEYQVFTERRKILAEKVLEIVLKTMAGRYSRGTWAYFVDDFQLPWVEHFPHR